MSVVVIFGPYTLPRLRYVTSFLVLIFILHIADGACPPSPPLPFAPTHFITNSVYLVCTFFIQFTGCMIYKICKINKLNYAALHTVPNLQMHNNHLQCVSISKIRLWLNRVDFYCSSSNGNRNTENIILGKNSMKQSKIK